MHKRALTLSAAGGAALVAALTAGLVINSNDASEAENIALGSAVKPSTSAAAPKTAAPKAATPRASASTSPEAAEQEAQAKKEIAKALLAGTTTASYFWDDGSGVNGDTGAPASGKPMQKGLFASPSWPLGTKVKVTYNGRSVMGFVGDRGPGTPSHNGVMLDLDTYTFRYLLDGGQPKSKYNSGTGEGHLKGVKWEVLQWGAGSGTRGAPQPF